MIPAWKSIPSAARPASIPPATAGNACNSDADRVALLLRNLDGIPWERRIARFRCFTAIAAPHGVIATVVGSIAGVVQYEPTGEHGFGYDPVFHLPSYARVNV